MPFNHLILCHLLLLLPSIFPSIRVFSNELPLHIRWLKYWSFSFSISPFNEYSGLISFRIDWFDLLVIQASLIQHNSSLWHTQEAQHNMPGLLWVKHTVSGPLPYSATGKDKSVAVQEMFEADFSYTTFSYKSLYCMLEKGSPIKDRRDNVCCGWQYQIAVSSNILSKKTHNTLPFQEENIPCHVCAYTEKDLDIINTGLGGGGDFLKYVFRYYS